jgi:RimJ/RimL family protein N-acetyltransferase
MYCLPLSERAELRPLEPWRATEFLTHLDRAREHIAPWVGASFVAADLAGATAVLKRYATAVADGGGGIHGIWRDGELVGGVMFVSLDGTTGVAELGCWLEPGAAGHGLVTLAAQALIDWAIRERGIVRFEWQTLSANTPSIRVAQRLGMQHDGTLRAAVPGRDGGPRQDMEVWSLVVAA